MSDSPYVLVRREPTPEMLEPFARQQCIQLGIDPDEPVSSGEYPNWYDMCSGFDELFKDALSASPAIEIMPVLEEVRATLASSAGCQACLQCRTGASRALAALKKLMEKMG